MLQLTGRAAPRRRCSGAKSGAEAVDEGKRPRGRGALGSAVKADPEGRLERTQVRMPARVASNPGEKPGHRKPKVSDATYIDVGLGGP